MRDSKVYDLECLLPFEPEPADSRLLVAKPQRYFAPRGLMLWDVGALMIEAMLFGRNLELVASFGKVPARWFTIAQSFEQVVASAAAGQEPGQGWGEWSTLYPGLEVRLIFDGDRRDVQALMWGHSIR